MEARKTEIATVIALKEWENNVKIDRMNWRLLTEKVVKEK